MKAKNKQKDRRSGEIDLKAKGCHNCARCIYIGDGDYLCDDDTPHIVIYAFSAPTEHFLACEGRRWKKQ